MKPRARAVGAAIVALLLGSSARAPARAGGPPTAAVETGRLSGERAAGVLTFKGIPYAAPPVGDLRWRAPQPAAPWAGIRAADHFGPACMQASRGAEAMAMSEDCLTLNIVRPDDRRRRLPVMVWIHGGALSSGRSSSPVFDGGAFARGGVILVSINYRLGRLGFFAHPALQRAAKPGEPLGNYGLLDQIAALRWIKANIAAFGGDPERVTVFGQSAGAASVDALLISPQARGLFQGAIAESQYWRGSWQRLSAIAPDGRKSAEADGIRMAEALGAPASADAAALRRLPAEDIVRRAGLDADFGFIMDGCTLPMDLWPAFRAGVDTPVPLILGANSLELGMMSADQQARLTAEYLTAGQLAALEPAYGGRDALAQNVISDIAYGAHARSLALLRRAHGHPTYLYRFSARTRADEAAQAGVRHGGEQAYVFETLPATAQARDRKVASGINAYWRGFAASGSPHASGLPAWPLYDGDAIVDFTNDGPLVGPDPRRARHQALAAAIDAKS